MTRVDAVRAELDAAVQGLPRALLSVSPDVVRNLARRAHAAAAVAARRRNRAGERPALDAEAAARVDAAYAAVTSARQNVDAAHDWALKAVTLGNAAGVGTLLGAVAMVLAGADPMSLPVWAAVVAGASASLAGFASAAGCRAQAEAGVAAAVEEWARGLERAGVPTMGSLAARRIALAGWERLEAEAAAAERAADHQREAWERVGGAGVDPGEVEAVVAAMERARLAHLRLFAAMLDQRATDQLLALDRWAPAPRRAVVHYLEPVTDPGVEPVADVDDDPAAVAGGALVATRAEATSIERTRGRFLHFWRVG